MLNVSDKAVSKWERGAGLFDIGLLPKLSEIFKVDMENILKGNIEENDFVGGNMKKTKFYVCPTCQNISFCTGEAEISCCGRKLKECIAEKADESHDIAVEPVENQWYLSSDHDMTKEHYISFIAFLTGEKINVIKQYPEWNLSVRLDKKEHGKLLWYCTKDGLFYKNI